MCREERLDSSISVCGPTGIQSVLARRLWKPGTNTCINGNTAGVIIQSEGKRILRVTGVLGMVSHLPYPRSPLAAASSALRSLCTNEREPCKGNSKGSSVYPLCHSSEAAWMKEVGQMEETILTWHTEAIVVSQFIFIGKKKTKHHCIFTCPLSIVRGREAQTWCYHWDTYLLASD